MHDTGILNHFVFGRVPATAVYFKYCVPTANLMLNFVHETRILFTWVGQLHRRKISPDSKTDGKGVLWCKCGLYKSTNISHYATHAVSSYYSEHILENKYSEADIQTIK